MNGNEIATVLGMLLVIAAVLLLAHYLPRFIAKSGYHGAGFTRQNPAHAQHLEVLERVAVARDQSLAVVRLDEHCFLVSVGGNSTQMLYELSAEEAAKIIQEHKQPQGAPGTGFYDTLKDALGRIKK
jgi:flagellar biogenesis protein FliO